jgi:uncharacterized protein YjlB
MMHAANKLTIFIPILLSFTSRLNAQEFYILIDGPAIVNENSSADYTCTAYYTDNSSQDMTGSAAWSENSAYATIDENGHLTTSEVSSDQSCTITAIFEDKSTVKFVLITNGTPTTATLNSITISGPDAVNENSSSDYICTGHYSDGSTQDVTALATWIETSPYASIDNNGHLTTTEVGSNQSITVTAVYQIKSAIKTIMITNTTGSATLISIIISGPDMVNENSSADYSCTAYYSDGSNQDVTSSAAWSENSLHASIDSDGHLTTSEVSSNQSCTVTAAYGGQNIDKTVTIINGTGTATLNSIIVSGPDMVDENSSANYACTAYYSDGTSQDVTGSAAWSENSPYASIDSNGHLTTSEVTSDQMWTITAIYGGESYNLYIIIQNGSTHIDERKNSFPPADFTLFQNFPNPFNSATTILYTVYANQIVKLDIYSMSGHIIKTLVNEKQTPGIYYKGWDGTDQLGKEVTSGPYIYILTQGNRVLTKRAILLK